MLLSETAKVKLNGGNIVYYEQLDYNIPREKNKWGKLGVLRGTIIEVKIEDLPENSHAEVEILCDYCEKVVVRKKYGGYINQNKKSTIHKDCCKACQPLKNKESNESVYGVSHISKLESTTEKRKQTNLNKYGFESYLQTEECKDRIKQTNLLTFGFDNPMQSERVKEKGRKTSLERYGVESYTQTDECKTKTAKTSLKKWGETSPMKNKEVRDKASQTNLERYGFENASSSPLIQEKRRKNVYEKYGVDYVCQDLEFQNKIKETINEKYGVDYYFQTGEFKETYKNTMLDKYGVDNPFKSEEVKEKIAKTKYDNNSILCSIQQRYICDLTNGELNYPIGSCNLDIAFLKENIYIEYDGSGHGLSVKFDNETIEHFEERNKRRWYFLKSKDWKSIQIISSTDKLPSDNAIIEMITYAKDYINTGHSWIKFIIDKNKIVNSLGEFDYDFGKLRKIKSNKEMEEVV